MERYDSDENGAAGKFGICVGIGDNNADNLLVGDEGDGSKTPGFAEP